MTVIVMSKGSRGILPCHPETLREEMKRITAESVAAFAISISVTIPAAVALGTTYAIDGSGLGSAAAGRCSTFMPNVLQDNWRLCPLQPQRRARSHGRREMVDEAWKLLVPRRLPG